MILKKIVTTCEQCKNIINLIRNNESKPKLLLVKTGFFVFLFFNLIHYRVIVEFGFLGFFLSLNLPGKILALDFRNEEEFFLMKPRLLSIVTEDSFQVKNKKVVNKINNSSRFELNNSDAENIFKKKRG